MNTMKRTSISKLLFAEKLFLLLLVWSMSSCIIKDIDIDLSEDHPHRVIVNGILEAGKYPELLVMHTMRKDDPGSSMAEGEFPFRVSEAEVTLHINGRLVEKRKLDSSNELKKQDTYMLSSPSLIQHKPLFYRGPDILNPGDQVKIEVSVPGYPDARVNQTVPLKANLEPVSVLEIRDKNNYFKHFQKDPDEKGDYRYLSYCLRYEDPKPAALQYYGIAARMFWPEDLSVELYSPIWPGVDPVFGKRCVDFFRGAYGRYRSVEAYPLVIPYFSNYDLPSGSRNLCFLTPILPEGMRHRFTLYTIDEMYFRYASMHYGLEDWVDKGDSSLFDPDDSFLVEKTPSLSNVEGGSGLVLARTAMTVEL